MKLKQNTIVYFFELIMCTCDIIFYIYFLNLFNTQILSNLLNTQLYSNLFNTPILSNLLNTQLYSNLFNTQILSNLFNMQLYSKTLYYLDDKIIK